MIQILYLQMNQLGALDSETSVQVMDLLKDVAKDRLVVMVTHNPELAENYANLTEYLESETAKEMSIMKFNMQ